VYLARKTAHAKAFDISIVRPLDLIPCNGWRFGLIFFAVYQLHIQKSSCAQCAEARDGRARCSGAEQGAERGLFGG